MKLKQYILACVIISGILIIACAKPPVDEMEMATDAVTRAENDADAVTYASNSITRARDALAQMNSEAAAKRYDSAKSYAAEAIAAAERAVSEGRSGAAHARSEASDLVSELKSLVDETTEALDTARSARLDLDYDSAERVIDDANDKTSLAQTALSEDRFQDAINLGRTARSELTGIQQLVSTAAAATAKK